MKLFKRAQKGFTLVELMVVMGIIAVLAAIIIPPITGTKQTSTESQAIQDATSVQTVVAKYHSAQNPAETLTSDDTQFSTSTVADTSNRWPEQSLAAGYSVEASKTVVIQDKNGDTDSAVATTRTAVDFDLLKSVTDGDTLYLQQTPKSVSDNFTAAEYHNYLFLLKKTDVEKVGDKLGRTLEVYSLQSFDAPTLTYKRIY